MAKKTRIFLISFIIMAVSVYSAVSLFFFFNKENTQAGAANSNNAVDVVYTITFDACGGSYVDEQIIREGKTAREVIPTWEGFEFLGWYLDEEYQNRFDFTTPITQNIVLYAKWSIEFELSEDGLSYMVSAYHGSSDVITIPSTYKGKPVVTIDQFAFEDATSLIVVRIQSGIEKICTGAFYNCKNLVKVDIPDTVTVIERNAFRKCPFNLESR
ncbi:MAG: InlB B-repeat-containing protein [Clostridia bacterium]|nr:InlB B-repeat-containing protein [Clostridia bacterium]